MATYIGFSTQGQDQRTRLTTVGRYGGVTGTTQSVPVTRRFTLVDYDLVIRDLLNAFNIRQGDKVGQPAYGSKLWGYLFEPSTADVLGAIEQEVRRIVGQDPRIILNSVYVNSQENGILLELELAVSPFNNALDLGILLDRSSGTATQVSSQ